MDKYINNLLDELKYIFPGGLFIHKLRIFQSIAIPLTPHGIGQAEYFCASYDHWSVVHPFHVDFQYKNNSLGLYHTWINRIFMNRLPKPIGG